MSQADQQEPQDGCGHDSDDDAEFFEAKESWDQIPAPKPSATELTTPLKCTEGPSLEEVKGCGSLQSSPNNRLNCPTSATWSDPQQRTKAKLPHGCFKSALNVVSAFSQQLSGDSSPVLTSGSTNGRGEHKAPELLYSRPTKPLPEPQAQVPIVPKQRVRVPPVAYVQTLKVMKYSLEFNPLCLQQELRAGAYPIYVAKFSMDGAFFATAGEDLVVRVWELGDYALQSAELLFNPKPLREYARHKKNVIDLSWCSKNTCMLLSAGLDNRIYLWNLNRASDPLCVFEISEPATAVCFLPDSDEYFASGSVDMIVRLWSTQTTSIVDWQKTSDVITSMSFSPDGRRLLLGLYKGKCLVYALDSMKFNYIAMINCRNRYGTYSGGRKVTGICFINNSEALVTTADSRLRVINLDDFSQKYKYKGHENTKVQMCATMSEDQDFVICGSEDGKVYIWNRFNQYVPELNPVFTGFKEDHNASAEYFRAFNEIPVTSVQFVPLSVLQKVSKAFSTYSPPANVKQIIVACSNDGQIRVFYQFIELE